MSDYNTNESTVTNQTITPPADGVVATYPLSTSTFWLTQQIPSLTPTSTSTPAQSTTVVPGAGQSYVSDVKISAYMRAVDIDIVAYNMRPNRRIYVFFDGKDVTKLIQQSNALKIDNGNDFIGILPTAMPENLTNVNISGAIVGAVDTSQETIQIAGGEARVLYTKEDTDGNKIVYISEIIQPNTQIDWANNTVSVYSPRTSSYANVVYTQATTGFITKAPRISGYTQNTTPLVIRSETERWYKLDIPFLKNDESLIGKTITLVNGPHPGETAQILDYVSSNGEIYISKDFTDFFSISNLVCTIGNVDPAANPQNFTTVGSEQIYYDSGIPDNVEVTGRNGSRLFTDENGVFAGTLRIPDPSLVPEYRFTAGEKLIRISDSPTNKPEDATTIAEYVFVSYGLNLTTSQIIINNQTTTQQSVDLPVPNLGDGTTPILPPIVSRGPDQTPINVESYNPLAQSFYVSPREHPNGMYVPYVDLFFANKGVLPIELQIRPMVGGYPDTTRLIPNAVAYLDASKVKITDNPDANDPNSYTRFYFLSPVYLQAEQEYALVLKTNDFDYDVYVSELGQTQVNSNRIVSQQPYTGVLFKSQNASTYVPIQDEDLMFVIHKCQFASAGTVFFNDEKDPTFARSPAQQRISSNTVYDSFELRSDSIQLNGTLINYSYRALDNTTKQLESSYTNFKPEKRTPITERKVLYGPDIPETSFQLRMDIATSSPDISPIIYKNKQSLSTIETLINDMGLDSYRVVVANTGNNYTIANTNVVISSNSGFGANAIIYTVVNKELTGQIAGLYFDGNGYGYYDDVNVTITSTDANASGAVVNILSETGKSGGPALARYISKTVTLAPEFDAGDLRVYLTAVRPRQADIEVYYKVKNTFDNEDISEKKWTRMVKVPGTVEYSSGLEPIEIEYRPSLSSNTINYSTNTATFNTFNKFKIKIVLASSSTLLQEIPYVYDMRAIALPGDE